MRRRRAWLALGAVVLVAVGAIITMVVARRPSPKAPEEAAAPPAAEAGTVKFLMEQQWAVRMMLAKAEPATVARQITATGRVVPAPGHHAVVAPPVGGLLDSGPLPRVGQTVARGQTLAALRQTPTASEAAQIVTSQAQAEIERARLEAERRRLAETARETELRLNHARVEFERAQRLFERKAYARRQLEAAETDYRAAEVAHAAAIAQRDALRESRVAAPSPSVNYTVQAPIGGTVVRVAKAHGEQVAPGEAIIELVNLDVVWIEVPIFEQDLARLGPTVRAGFSTPAAPGREFTGRVIDLGSVIHRESRSATLVFEVANRERALRIGQQANVRLDAGERIAALMIPKNAVLEAEGKRFVYVLRSGEEFERREVTLGDEHGDRVTVLQGLKAGERVVTQGAWQLRQHELRPSAPGTHTHET
jgi:cobalt-zinc-cadmium efflux system membrane fusion protein